VPETPTLASALVELQAELPHVTKDAENPHFRSRYASLAALTAALLPLMAKLGLAWICRPTLEWSRQEPMLVLSYSLRHVSGESLDGQYPLPASGTPQQIGSAITYARRYALCAVTGLVADDDDDGNAAEQAAPPQPASVGLSAEERQQRGMMTTAQRREHTALKPGKDRPADRANDPADDIWAGQPPGDWQPPEYETRPGTSNSKQWQRLGILYTQLGITERDTRLKDMQDRAGRDITSAKDLSYVEAQQAITDLEKLAAQKAAK